MAKNPVYERLRSLYENDLRTEVILPILAKTPGVQQVTDVHGTNEKGLDVIFCTVDAIRKTWYGLQLKRGDISGGGTGKRTVKEVVDQLELAVDYRHPVSTPPSGRYQMERFIVATSGRISNNAREEIADRVKPIVVEFWDLAELVSRARDVHPDILQIADTQLVEYLTRLRDESEQLDPK